MAHLRAVRQAFDYSPRLPIAGSLVVSAFNEKVQIGLRFLYGVTALHAVDLFSKYSLSLRVLSKNTLEVWDALADS